MDRFRYFANWYLGAGLLVGTVALSGCALSSTPIRILDRNPHPFPPSSQIEVVSSQLSSSRYTMVAKLQVTGSPNQSRAQLISLLEQKAGEMGANGLLILHEEVEIVGYSGPTTFNPAGGNYEQASPEKVISVEALAVRLLPER